MKWSKKDGFQFFGLDYASTRLGVDYGILSWLSTGIGRSMSVQTCDLALKAGILKQNESNIPLSLSWSVSFLENTSQSSEWAGQLILTNTVGSWSKGHIYFGFNLTRVFHPKMN